MRIEKETNDQGYETIKVFFDNQLDKEQNTSTFIKENVYKTIAIHKKDLQAEGEQIFYQAYGEYPKDVFERSPREYKNKASELLKNLLTT